MLGMGRKTDTPPIVHPASLYFLDESTLAVLFTIFVAVTTSDFVPHPSAKVATFVNSTTAVF